MHGVHLTLAEGPARGISEATQQRTHLHAACCAAAGTSGTPAAASAHLSCSNAWAWLLTCGVQVEEYQSDSQLKKCRCGMDMHPCIEAATNATHPTATWLALTCMVPKYIPACHYAQTHNPMSYCHNPNPTQHPPKTYGRQNCSSPQLQCDSVNPPVRAGVQPSLLATVHIYIQNAT